MQISCVFIYYTVCVEPSTVKRRKALFSRMDLLWNLFPLFVFQHHLWPHSVHQQEPLGFCCPRGRLLSDQRGERHRFFFFFFFFMLWEWDDADTCWCLTQYQFLKVDSGSFQTCKPINVQIHFMIHANFELNTSAVEIQRKLNMANKPDNKPDFTWIISSAGLNIHLHIQTLTAEIQNDTSQTHFRVFQTDWRTFNLLMERKTPVPKPHFNFRPWRLSCCLMLVCVSLRSSTRWTRTAASLWRSCRWTEAWRPTGYWCSCRPTSSACL